MGERRLSVVAALIALSCVAIAFSTTAYGAPRTLSVVALGDSVPRGTNCRCRPYPPLTGDRLRARSGRTVTAINGSVGGFTTSDVLRQLKSDDRVGPRNSSMSIFMRSRLTELPAKASLVLVRVLVSI
jgi:hypothetical protein